MPGPARKTTTKPSRAALTKKKTPENWDLFLAHLAGKKVGDKRGEITAANLTRSAQASGMERSTVYDKRRNDPEFEARFQQAYQDGYDVLEEMAQARAFDGFQKVTKDGKGNIIKTEDTFSDTLAVFLMKGNKAEKFRDRVETIDATPSGPSRLSKLTDAELEEELKRRLG